MFRRAWIGTLIAFLGSKEVFVVVRKRLGRT